MVALPELVVRCWPLDLPLTVRPVSLDEEASVLNLGTDFMSWLSIVSPPEAGTFCANARGSRRMLQVPVLESDGGFLPNTSAASTLSFPDISCRTTSD